jgi:hypothetical protein
VKKAAREEQQAPLCAIANKREILSGISPWRFRGVHDGWGK